MKGGQAIVPGVPGKVHTKLVQSEFGFFRQANKSVHVLIRQYWERTDDYSHITYRH